MNRTSPDPDSPAAGAAADPGTLRALEFGEIVARLAALTAFAPSRELAEATLPSADAALVALLNDQTDEAANLVERQPQAGVGGARDIRVPLQRAARGGRLAPLELFDIGVTLYAVGQLRAQLSGPRGPRLAALREALNEVLELRERIERSIDEGGEILDTASPELGAIRRRMRQAQDRVRERLNAMLRDTNLAGAIGEAIVTLRAGRYVIPVRAEAKSRVKGIVHDQSASGATLFVEPLGVVELNNAWTEATLEEAREQERICEALSREIEANADAIGDSLDALATADLWMARARLGTQMDALRPAVSDDAWELLSARHPLLGVGVVPIDVRLGEPFGYRAMIVTGPNTGGKTVTLKTIGLLALMHQAGLRVPVAGGSRIPVYARVMADIGDEQSIAQSLSTCSGHLRNIVRFVRQAGPRSLVLLDEIGAGTDPTEGSALAAALVARLLDAGATLAATTHYAELKTFAETHPGVTNAAVEFDVRTLRPTYRLRIGLPGKSQAFAIAQRLGLPEPILADAAGRLSAEHRTMEETLAAISRAEEQQTDALAQAQASQQAAQAELERARSGVARARREAATMLAEARRAANELLERAEREATELRRELGRHRVGSRRKAGAETARAGLETIERRAREARRRAQRAEPKAAGGADEAEAEGEAEGEPQPRPGLWARSRTLGSAGRIVEVSGRTGRVTLETEDARLVLPGEDVEVVPEPAPSADRPDANAEELRRRAAARVSPTLDLRGERVEAALEQLDGYLDQALLAGLDQIVIRHGTGTGALRRAIRERLAAHPRVRGTRSGRREEGGDQATVVEL
jgi:DNA mismatch repair protein MutS2